MTTKDVTANKCIGFKIHYRRVYCEGVQCFCITHHWIESAGFSLAKWNDKNAPRISNCKVMVGDKWVSMDRLIKLHAVRY